MIRTLGPRTSGMLKPYFVRAHFADIFKKNGYM